MGSNCYNIPGRAVTPLHFFPCLSCFPLLGPLGRGLNASFFLRYCPLMVDYTAQDRYSNRIEQEQGVRSGQVPGTHVSFNTLFVLILTPVGISGFTLADAPVFLDLLFFNPPQIWESKAQFRADTFSSSRQRKQDWHWGTWGPWTPVQDRFLTVLLILLERTNVTAWKFEPSSSEVKIELLALCFRIWLGWTSVRRTEQLNLVELQR